MTVTPAEPLRSYFREITATPLLSAREERALAERVADGDPEAREDMIKANLRLVVHLARGFLGKGLPLEDLISEGNIGLVRAVEGFDVTQETRFGTYASFWIKQSMRRALIGDGASIRLPVYMLSLIAKWRRAGVVLADELGRAPTDAEIGKALRLSRKKIGMVASAMKAQASCRSFQSADDGDVIGDLLADERSRPCDEVLDEADCLGRVRSRMEQLDDREASVLRARFGLDGIDPRTLQEIGDDLRLTRERVRQIEALALAKLTETFADRGLAGWPG